MNLFGCFFSLMLNFQSLVCRLKYKKNSHLSNIPMIEGKFVMKFKTKNSSKDKDFYIAGYGINLLTGLKSCFENISHDIIDINSKSYSSIRLASLDNLNKFLKPFMIFKIIIGCNHQGVDIAYKSTLLYVDSNDDIVVVTRPIYHIIKPLVFIWMMTYDLLKVVEEDDYTVRNIKVSGEKETFNDFINLNFFKKNCLVIKNQNLKKISEDAIVKFKTNILTCYTPYLNRTEKEQLFALLKQNSACLIPLKSWDQLLRSSIERVYKMLKHGTNENYLKFPMYDILMKNQSEYDGLGPVKSREVSLLELSKYLV